MKALSIIAAILFLLSAASAQTKPSSAKRRPAAPPSSAHKLAEIKVTGTALYSPAQVIASTGLKLGQTVNEDVFKEAVQKLGETRLFTNVAYSYSFSGEGTKLELQLTDNEKLVPVEFDNLVWFSRQGLLDKIHAAIPLFQGKVPAGGGLVDEIADILSAMLAQKNPQLHLDYLRSGADTTNAVVFSVSGTDIRIQKVEYPGAGASHLPALNSAARKIEGADYQHSVLAAFTKFDLQPIYLKDGFLKVSFGEPQPQVVHDSPDETVVDVKLPVEEGQQYKLAKIEFSGNSVFSSEKLRPMLHVQPTATANAIQLRNDLEAIRHLYGTNGRVKAKVELQPEFSDPDATVSYNVQVTEGDVYKMGELDFDGLEEKLIPRMREDWTLRAGEVYNSSYPQIFVKQAIADLPSGPRWSINAQESINEQDKTVDVTLRFSKAE